jgi:uncharacterized protein YggE
MMQRSNIYVIASAVLLAIIIMGGVSVYFLLSHSVDTSKVQTSNQLLGTSPNVISTSTPNLIATKNESLIMPYNANPRTLSLSGTGKVTIKANQAIIILGVYTEGKSADYAEQENALRMTDVMNSLKALGIPDTDMQTISYTINPEYDYDLKMTVGYQVTNTLQITVDDLTKVGSIIDKTSTAGANTISSVTFTVSDAEFAKYKLQAYSLAVSDVQAKEKAITDGFGITVAGIQSINENYYFPMYQNVYTTMDSKSAGVVPSTPIVSGTLDISITLNVVYLLS